MKRFIIITALSLFCISILFSSNVLAQSKADKYLGKRTLCLDLVNIRNTRILDDQTILFSTYGEKVYINRLPASCFDLRNSDAFSYETSLDRLCRQDIIEVVENPPGQGSKCGLGKFIELKGVKRIDDAVKLLIDKGLLKELVKEGAFKDTKPPMKGK
jgi:hypothetical protein